MFGELKTDLEADVAFADEDPETTTISRIAFREMGLLDEAIGELQKPAKVSIAAARSRKSFRPTPGRYSVSWKWECPKPPSVGTRGR